MAHTIGTIPARSTVTTANPVTFDQAVLQFETVFALLIKGVGATNRAGGVPTYDGMPFLEGFPLQKAAAAPEGSVEAFYALNLLPRTYAISIPNTDGISLYYQVVMGRAKNGGRSYFVGGSGANATSSNPACGAIETKDPGNLIIAAVASGAQAWSPSAWTGTVISDNDDGAHGWGAQYLLQATAASVNMSWTESSDDWGAIAMAFGEVDTVRLNNYLMIEVKDGMSMGDKIR